MKKKLLSFFLLFTAVIAGGFSQTTEIIPVEEKTSALDIGFLMGGGSLIGADLECLFLKKVGIQMGGGITSLGMGLTFHLKPQINSSYFSLQYMRQGWGELGKNSHYASYIAPMFNFRAKKIFQAGVGIGYIVDKGNRFYHTNKNAENITMSLIFNIGVYHFY